MYEKVPPVRMKRKKQRNPAISLILLVIFSSFSDDHSRRFKMITLLSCMWSITLIMPSLSVSSSSWPYHPSQMITLIFHTWSVNFMFCRESLSYLRCYQLVSWRADIHSWSTFCLEMVTLIFSYFGDGHSHDAFVMRTVWMICVW